jgi:branched-chain amino acid transport system substrate-binding protein
MAVAQRHNFVMPQHTAVLAPQLTYSCQFPAWSIGPTPNKFIPNQLFDAVASLPTRRRIAI